MRRTPLLLASFALAMPMLLGMGCKLGGNSADDSLGDPPGDAGTPNPLGPGSRIRNLIPKLTKSPDAGGLAGTSNPDNGENEYITGASLITIDTYDETHNGKSIGAVYVQDVGSTAPYSGIELYKPTYSPANLLVTPGDVLDMTGLYQNYQYTSFSPDEVVPELSEPVVTLRFQWTVPPSAVIDPTDISGTVATSPDASVYAQGLRWESMLVEVDDVTITGNYTDPAGRVQIYFTSDTTNGPSIANQLMPLDPTDAAFKTGTQYAKIIGVCGFFFTFTISPRSMADLVLKQ
jgi:hypothetical protein